jgi:hypothetical protein
LPSTGTFSDDAFVIGWVFGSSVGTVSVGQYLALWGPAPCGCRIGGIQAHAATAGSGGPTVLDVLVDGVSIWQQLADKPTLAAASTGGFALAASYARAVGKGQRVDIRVIASAGHALVRCTIALERARDF